MYDLTLKLILSLDHMTPSPALPKRLDSLFAQLRLAPPQPRAYEIEDLIWALWIDHADREIAKRMEASINAIAMRSYGRAEELLSGLIADVPTFAEAWNKRATLFYIQHRDRESVADIEQTLRLEPRHFGAICGFAQICHRGGDPGSALVAFEAALRINPHMENIQAVVTELRRSLRGTVH